MILFLFLFIFYFFTFYRYIVHFYHVCTLSVIYINNNYNAKYKKIFLCAVVDLKKEPYRRADGVRRSQRHQLP